MSEYLLERMLAAGVTRICFVIAPGKSDIVNYYGGRYGDAAICYTVQAKPNGLCDAIFTGLSVVDPNDDVLIGLPDTVWFPENGFNALPRGRFSFLLFPVALRGLIDQGLLAAGHGERLVALRMHFFELFGVAVALCPLEIVLWLFATGRTSFFPRDLDIANSCAVSPCVTAKLCRAELLFY